MRSYKLAIQWANGKCAGYLGHGRDEDEAKNNAIAKVFRDSERLSMGFSIVKTYDVMFLSKDDADQINKDWDYAAMYPHVSP